MAFPDQDRCVTRDVVLEIAYQGTHYCGWQTQPNLVSIQQTLEQAFCKMTGKQARARVAGRTDSGVHAFGQVVCMHNASRHSPEALWKGLNALLPDDIVIKKAAWAEPGFNPRYHAVGKHYRYFIHTGPVKPVYTRDYCWHYRGDLDLAAMNQAAQQLVGFYDFSSFRGSKCEAKSPVRSIDLIQWHRTVDQSEPGLGQGMGTERDFIVLDVCGRSFLKQMVRIFVGTLVEIGRGRLAADQIKPILEGRKRDLAGPTAPAQGLFLMRVFYDISAYNQVVTKLGQQVKKN